MEGREHVLEGDLDCGAGDLSSSNIGGVSLDTRHHVGTRVLTSLLRQKCTKERATGEMSSHAVEARAVSRISLQPPILDASLDRNQRSSSLSWSPMPVERAPTVKARAGGSWRCPARSFFQAGR